VKASSPTFHRASRLLEPGILVGLALFSLVPIAAMVRHAIAYHVLLSGAGAAFANDQFQYLSWVREYGHHLLAGNLMDVAPSGRVFLHPMLLLSGWASRAGLSVPDAYQLWKPVAAIALFVGFRAYVARFLPTPRLRLITLAIALFYATPAAAIVAWGSIGSFAVQRNFDNAAGELLPAEFLWGYLPSAISVALMPLFLLGVERLVRDSPAGRVVGRPRDLLAVSACGLVASWLHPWQGETLLVIVAGAVALDRFSRRYVVLAIPLIALTAPLVYYFVLSHADPAWRLAAHLNTRWGHVPLWALVLCVLPLALPAALSLRKPSADLGERMLKLWPLAGAAVYLVLSPSFPQHALDSLSLPLAGSRRGEPRPVQAAGRPARCAGCRRDPARPRVSGPVDARSVGGGGTALLHESRREERARLPGECAQARSGVRR
jgi:hypothetical protein